MESPIPAAAFRQASSSSSERTRFPPSLAWNQRYSCRQLLDLAPLKRKMEGAPENLQRPIDSGYRVLRLPLLLIEGRDCFCRYPSSFAPASGARPVRCPNWDPIVCERRRFIGKVRLDVREKSPA